jgi:uncharacterized protein
MTDRRPFREGLLTLDPLALVGSQCRNCGTTSYPSRDVCPGCRKAGDAESVTLSRRGTVHTFTVVRQAPPGVEVPYVLAYVDLPEQVRVMAQIVADPVDAVEIGMQVDLVERPMGEQDGTQLVGYQFVPAG